jgi:hypothetical protein
LGGRGETPPVTMAMRKNVLGGIAKDFGLTPIATVWGVLMEMGYPEGWATLVALSDGTGSLYLSSGGGIIGGGFHEKVKKAAIDLCRLAGGPVFSGPIVRDFPTPNPGRIRFYILTDRRSANIGRVGRHSWCRRT